MTDRAGNPTFLFGKERDVLYLRSRDAELHKLYYKPKRWLVVNQSLGLLNMYGEPGDAVSGSSGVTSAAATRRLTDATTNFVTAGVIAGDLIEVFSVACDSDEDNGRYVISEVTSATVVTINQNWPEGGNTGLGWRVESLSERYTEFERPLPFLAKFNPTKQELQKWGLQEQRDCLIEASIELFNSYGLYEPKIGDRFIYPYDVKFGIRNIHYEITELWPGDQIGDSQIPLHWIGAAKRTTNKLPNSSFGGT